MYSRVEKLMQLTICLLRTLLNKIGLFSFWCFCWLVVPGVEQWKSDDWYSLVPLPWFMLRYQWFYPLLLLYHQYKYQYSKKGRSYLTIFMEIAYFWTILWTTLMNHTLRITVGQKWQWMIYSTHSNNGWISEI